VFLGEGGGDAAEAAGVVVEEDEVGGAEGHGGRGQTGCREGMLRRDSGGG
jgi:hypothetical protein